MARERPYAPEATELPTATPVATSVTCISAGQALGVYHGVAVGSRHDIMQITKHAELRYRQRVDSSEPFPREKLRELYEDAEPAPDAVSEGVGYVVDDVTLAVRHDREPVVTTVLRGSEA
jgi:hypothetical protein